jgi:hypothetical protein
MRIAALYCVILRYASNAAERVACHYKERSLTFRIVASRVLSRAPPPPLQPTQSDLPLTAFAARVSEWQHLSKKCSVSLSWRAPILWSLRRAFRRKFHNVQYRPSPKNIQQWFQQLQDTGCLCKRKSPPIVSMLSVLLVVVILRGSNTCLGTTDCYGNIAWLNRFILYKIPCIIQCVLVAVLYYWLLGKYRLIKSAHVL